MSAWIGAAFLVAGFLFLMRLFRLVEQSRRAVDTARRSFEVIRSREMTDEEKETTLQKNTLVLFRLAVLLTVGGAGAVLLPVGPLWLCDYFGWISLDAVFALTLSPTFLIGGSVLAVVTVYLIRKAKPDANGYSSVDRLLHQIAFHTSTAQVALADMEDQLFAKQLNTCKNEQPVFITAIPRAGTTLLLECCANLPEFASHCYRDMPFVLIPCLWSRFSASFRKQGELRQRAHGDGMLIDFDSPEALEEVVWKAFWRKHYCRDRITVWHEEDNDEFNDFFRSHMKKIVHLRRGADSPGARYLSKNNLNIARIPMLRRLYPESTIVIPFRHPLHHAASLQQQHRRFLGIHREDRFASQYMRAIGHYDFGENLCPVDFDGWFDRREIQDTDSLAFWVEYWVSSYRYLLDKNAAEAHFLGYEALCENPQYGLGRLAEVIDSRAPEALMATGARMRPPRPRELDTSAIPASLLREADQLHASLKDASLNKESRYPLRRVA